MSLAASPRNARTAFHFGAPKVNHSHADARVWPARTWRTLLSREAAAALRHFPPTPHAKIRIPLPLPFSDSLRGRSERQSQPGSKLGRCLERRVDSAPSVPSPTCVRRLLAVQRAKGSLIADTGLALSAQSDYCSAPWQYQGKVCCGICPSPAVRAPCRLALALRSIPLR